MNKTQMRNMLRKYIQESNYLEAGVEGIVDQVVGPKILPLIEPEVESIMYKMFGVEKPEQDSEEDMETEENKEKLSTISSDIEMKSADEAAKVSDAASSPGPGLRGDMSPLTPDKNSPPRGDMSPLTPPPPGTEILPKGKNLGKAWS